MYIYVINIYIYICINIMLKVQGLNVGNVFAAKPSVSVKLYILNKSSAFLWHSLELQVKYVSYFSSANGNPKVIHKSCSWTYSICYSCMKFVHEWNE